jgi:hypothetical protein
MKNKAFQAISNKPLFLVVAATLVLVSFVMFAELVGLTRVLDRMFDADAIWLLLVIGAQSIAYWAYVIPYKHIFKLNFKEATRHSFAGFHPTLPRGGFNYDVVTQCEIGKKARVYYLGLWEYVALAPAVMIAAIYAYIHGAVPAPLSLPWIIGVPTGSIIFGMAVLLRKRIVRFPKAHKLLEIMLDMLRQQSLKEIFWLMGGMVVYWTGEIFALWGALQLFHVSLGWFELLIAYGTGYVVSRRSLPLGGAGLVLVGLALSLHWVGAALSVTLLVALAYQVFNLLMPVLYRRLAGALA